MCDINNVWLQCILTDITLCKGVALHNNLLRAATAVKVKEKSTVKPLDIHGQVGQGQAKSQQ